MYICSRTRLDRSGVLWLGDLRLDTCQGEEKAKETLSCMADTWTESECDAWSGNEYNAWTMNECDAWTMNKCDEWMIGECNAWTINESRHEKEKKQHNAWIGGRKTGSLIRARTTMLASTCNTSQDLHKHIVETRDVFCIRGSYSWVLIKRLPIWIWENKDGPASLGASVIEVGHSCLSLFYDISIFMLVFTSKYTKHY